MGFAERLREQRKKLGMTTTQCAAELGITQPAYNQWELGVREPKFLMLKQLCALLDISADELLGIDRGTSAAVIVNGSGNAVANGAHAKAKAGPDCKTCPFKQAALEFAAKLPRKR